MNGNIRQFEIFWKTPETTRDHFTKTTSSKRPERESTPHTHCEWGSANISVTPYVFTEKETNNRQRTKHKNERVEPAKQPKDKMHKEKGKRKETKNRQTSSPTQHPETQTAQTQKNAAQKKKVTGREHWVGLQKSEKHGNK
jgi:hypothetical protein